MSREGATQVKILTVLSNGKPRTSKEINKELRLGSDSIESALGRMWRSSRILRTAKSSMSNDRVFKGRAGTVNTQRQYHSYMLGPVGIRFPLDFSDKLGNVFFGRFSERYA